MEAQWLCAAASISRGLYVFCILVWESFCGAKDGIRRRDYSRGVHHGSGATCIILCLSMAGVIVGSSKSLIGMSQYSRARRRSFAVVIGTGLVTASRLQGKALAASPVVTIAAASDLKFVLEEVSRRLLVDTGAEVRLVFGSSGNLARQIQQGAPFDIFMSADEQLVEQLSLGAKTLSAGVHYATGSLVMIAGSYNPLALGTDLRSAVLASPRIAIANPDHAPYGRAALQALVASGFPDGLRQKWAVADNVLQATQYVLTGAAPLGFTAKALVVAPELADKLLSRAVAGELHAPIRQRIALTRRASLSAEKIMNILLSTEAGKLFQRYGYLLPETRS